MNTINEQKQSRWIFSHPMIVISGYLVLALALVGTGLSAGYSSNTMEHLVEHIAASAFLKLWIFLLIFALFRKPITQRLSRNDMNKSHLYIFVLTCGLVGVGILLMAQHNYTNVQNWCFSATSFAIAWSMGLEYQFAGLRKQTS